MGQRRRHHLVARFLLKRFAAKVDGDKSFVWRFSRDATPKLLSTRDVGVQSNFYGNEDEGLEGELSVVEGRWASLLARVDAGEQLDLLADELWHMLYLTAFRTSPIRSAFRTVGERFIDHMHDNADSQNIKDELQRRLDEEFDDQLTKVLDKCPPEIREAAWANRGMLKQRVQDDMLGSGVGSTLRGLIGQLQEEKVFATAAKRGHNTGVAKMIEQGQGPAAIKPVAWRVIHDPAGSIVLGDCAVVATGASTAVPGAPWKFGRECRSFYLPISPHRVLVGLRYPEDMILPIHTINSSSAELSESCYFASTNNEQVRQWSAVIARRWMPLDDAELESLMRNAIGNTGNKATEDGDQ